VALDQSAICLGIAPARSPYILQIVRPGIRWQILILRIPGLRQGSHALGDSSPNQGDRLRQEAISTTHGINN
jgi:hypothetical protein